MRFPGAVGGAKNLHYRTRELTYEKGHTLFVLGPSRKVVEVPGFFSEILKKKSSGLFFSYLFSLLKGGKNRVLKGHFQKEVPFAEKHAGTINVHVWRAAVGADL